MKGDLGWSQASCLISLGLRFLICKMGIKISFMRCFEEFEGFFWSLLNVYFTYITLFSWMLALCHSCWTWNFSLRIFLMSVTWMPQRWRFIASERLLLHFDHLYLLPQCLHLEAVGAIRERGGRDYCLIPEIIGVVGRNDKTDGWAGWKPIIKAVGVPRRLGVPGPIGLGVESFIGA